MNPGGSMTGGSVAKEAGFLSRANELKRLTAQEATLQAQKEETEAALAEAQRAVEKTEFELTATREQLRAAEDEVLRLEGEEKAACCAPSGSGGRGCLGRAGDGDAEDAPPD